MLKKREHVNLERKRKEKIKLDKNSKLDENFDLDIEELLGFNFAVEDFCLWLLLFLKITCIVFPLPSCLFLKVFPGPRFFLICNLPAEDNFRGLFCLLCSFFSNFNSNKFMILYYPQTIFRGLS